MANNRQPFKLRDMAFDVLARQGLFSIELPAETTQAYRHGVTSFLEQMTLEKLMPKFLQAVVDDDRTTVKAMLDINPELLFINPPANLVIESQKTWQKFYAESALNMAAKRKQIKMIELLLPYYDKLEQTDELIQAKAEALATWKAYEVQKNKDREEEIAIPQEYAYLEKSLIDTFKAENFPNGMPGKNDVPMNVALSERAELAYSSLLNILVPKNAVKLDDYLDPELFLLALYQAYRDKFNTFQNWDQRDVFCVRMIGLAQSVLSPETAKIFCEGLYYVVEERRKIGTQAASLKLKGGESFYRLSRVSRSGLSFDFLCFSPEGLSRPFAPFTISLSLRAGRGMGWFALCLEKSCQTKAANFLEYYAAAAATAKPTLSRS